MDDVAVEWLLAAEEFLTDPQQIVLALPVNGNAWSDPGVYKQEIAAFKSARQRPQKLEVRARYCRREFVREGYLLVTAGRDGGLESVGQHGFKPAV